MEKSQIKTSVRKKDRILLAVLMVLLLVATSITVYAYFTTKKTVTNSINLGYNDIEVKENFEPPLNLTAGTTFTKEPYVFNAGNVACYVRIKCVVSDSRIEQFLKIYYDENKQRSNPESEGSEESGYDKDLGYNREFEYNEEDGYWYYKHVLDPNEQTPPLFNTVKIADNADDTVQNGFDIYVYAESIQAVGDDTNEDVTMEEVRSHFQKR